MASPENMPSASKRASLQVIATTAMIGGWALLLAYIVGYYISSDVRFVNLIINEVGLGAFLTLVWFLQSRGRYLLSIWVLYISAFTLVATFNFLVEGLGLTIGIVMALVFVAIAGQILPARLAILVSIFSVLGSLAFYFIDTHFAPGGRLQANFLLQELIIIIGSIIFFILVINGLRSVEFRSISAQIRTSFFIISFIPLFIVAILQTLSLVNYLKTQSDNQLFTDATILAGRVDTLMQSGLIEIHEDATNSDVVNFFKKPDRNTTLASVLYLRYEHVLSYGLLGTNGYLLIDNRGNISGNESETDYFQKAAKNLVIYTSDVVLDPITGKTAYYISAPVKDEQGILIGVIRIKFDAGVLQETAENAGKELGSAITVSIIDDANIVLAHSTAPTAVGKILAAPNTTTISDLQQAGRLPIAPNLILNLNELAKDLELTSAKPIFTTSVSPGDTEQDNVTFAKMQVKPWKAVVSEHPTAFLTPAFAQLITLGIIMLVVMGAVIFGANLTASLLANPVNELATAAKKIGAGDLDTSIQITRKDELGTLGLALDNSSRQVRELLQTLESRVAERTAELSLANEKYARRAAQLETISQVAHSIASLSDPNQLLPEITKQISESFGYYHVGIFLVDENRDYAILRAANSEGGKTMLSRGHRLKVGREGIVGNVTNSGHYRVALDVGADAVFFNNPDLPNTHSEIAIPLRVGEEIIGALDVQSTEPDAFSEDDIKALTLLSDQISVAIENARLFDETRATLAQMQQTYSETSAAGWQAITSDSSTTGYRFIRGSIEPIHQKSDVITVPRGNESLEIPIVLRGEKLGTLRIRRTGRQQQWSEAETRMYQAIVERMSFALENARLFSDARRRANLERLASDATAKISSSVQFDTILRTAAEEISRILDGSEVLVQIQPDVIDRAGKSKS